MADNQDQFADVDGPTGTIDNVSKQKEQQPKADIMAVPGEIVADRKEAETPTVGETKITGATTKPFEATASEAKVTEATSNVGKSAEATTSESKAGAPADDAKPAPASSAPAAPAVKSSPSDTSAKTVHETTPAIAAPSATGQGPYPVYSSSFTGVAIPPGPKPYYALMSSAKKTGSAAALEAVVGKAAVSAASSAPTRTEVLSVAGASTVIPARSTVPPVVDPPPAAPATSVSVASVAGKPAAAPVPVSSAPAAPSGKSVTPATAGNTVVAPAQSAPAPSVSVALRAAVPARSVPASSPKGLLSASSAAGVSKPAVATTLIARGKGPLNRAVADSVHATRPVTVVPPPTVPRPSVPGTAVAPSATLKPSLHNFRLPPPLGESVLSGFSTAAAGSTSASAAAALSGDELPPALKKSLLEKRKLVPELTPHQRTRAFRSWASRRRALDIIEDKSPRPIRCIPTMAVHTASRLVGQSLRLFSALPQQAAIAVEKFGQEIYLPYVLAAHGDTKGMDHDRIFYSTLLALRQVIALNASRLLDLPPAITEPEESFLIQLVMATTIVLAACDAAGKDSKALLEYIEQGQPEVPEMQQFITPQGKTVKRELALAIRLSQRLSKKDAIVPMPTACWIAVIEKVPPALSKGT